MLLDSKDKNHSNTNKIVKSLGNNHDLQLKTTIGFMEAGGKEAWQHSGEKSSLNMYQKLKVINIILQFGGINNCINSTYSYQVTLSKEARSKIQARTSFDSRGF